VRYTKSRFEAGKMLFDITKYVITVIVIGGIFSKSIGFKEALFGIFIAIALFITGFIIIPRWVAKVTVEEGK